ncbi:TPA: DNA cytosine methyltransferase, partial [Streptococcus pyogenes]|nr:DNA cytosine methyltransferase [Streptococcus pyogenes]
DEILKEFYEIILPKYKSNRKTTVKDAISDLPKLFPLEHDINFNGRRTSYTLPEPFIQNHVARWHSERDKKVFKLLTTDIESGRNEYVSTEKLKELYMQITGKNSNVHKYYVLRWDKPSNLIPAHLYKDGLRHIHPDSSQLRTLTVREAARLQTFPDDYVFYGSNTETYKMIGNAVPPLFSKKLALALKEFLDKYDQGGK